MDITVLECYQWRCQKQCESVGGLPESLCSSTIDAQTSEGPLHGFSVMTQVQSPMVERTNAILFLCPFLLLFLLVFLPPCLWAPFSGSTSSVMSKKLHISTSCVLMQLFQTTNSALKGWLLCEYLPAAGLHNFCHLNKILPFSLQSLLPSSRVFLLQIYESSKGPGQNALKKCLGMSKILV